MTVGARVKRIVAASFTLLVTAAVIESGAWRYQNADPRPVPQVIPKYAITFAVKSPPEVSVAVDDKPSIPLEPGARLTLPIETHKFRLTSPIEVGAFVVEISIGPTRLPTDTEILAVYGVLKVPAETQVKINKLPFVRMVAESRVTLGTGPHTIEFAPMPATATQTFTLAIETPTL